MNAVEQLATEDSDSPFHRGEREIQRSVGVRERMEARGRRFIRDFLPEQHRNFYRQLPFLLLGTVDARGRPWASILFGRPGFVDSPHPRSLTLASRPLSGDPLHDYLTEGLDVGVLGIEYHKRRRNRLAARVSRCDDGGIELAVGQTFGNCPRYIQTREAELLPAIDRLEEPRPVRNLTVLGERERAIIRAADHFYIATHFSEKTTQRSEKEANSAAHGADVSHRGGKPGFMRVDDERTLTFPDFNGNLHYNTLGNLSVNPRAGLLFIDFERGDLLYLSCTAEIIWDSDERRAFSGAESLVRLRVEEGRVVENAVPLRWRYGEASPVLAETGSWEEVAEKLAQGKLYRDYTVTRNEDEGCTLKQPASPLSADHKYGELPEAQVRFEHAGIDATWEPASGSLLDLAEAHGLQPAFSCRSGVCQTCATRVQAGEVAYSEPPRVAPEPGTALICCSHPLTDGSGDGQVLKLDL